jgi:pimeloyl-ACP methyl ester carboxylesterase
MIPDIQVALIPGAHHITALAQPELTNEQVIQFLTTPTVTTTMDV